MANHCLDWLRSATTASATAVADVTGRMPRHRADITATMPHGHEPRGALPSRAATSEMRSASVVLPRTRSATPRDIDLRVNTGGARREVEVRERLATESERYGELRRLVVLAGRGWSRGKRPWVAAAAASPTHHPPPYSATRLLGYVGKGSSPHGEFRRSCKGEVVVAADDKTADDVIEEGPMREGSSADTGGAGDSTLAPAATIAGRGRSAVPTSGGVWKKLTDRTLDHYPRPGPRFVYLGMVVVASIVLWYQYYTPTAVATLLLPYYHLSFHFYVNVIVAANLAGVIAALVGGITDRIGRVNVVIFGLLIVGLIQFAAIPNTTSKGLFVAEIIAIGLFEGIILVATPALVRDFTPQLGRAAAMGFWTLGPVAGVLIASLVGSHTLSATSTDWQREFLISGAAGLIVFVLALLFLRELSPGIRDQLMVSSRDRELIELRAKGLDVEAATRNPWRHMLKLDVILSAVAISVMLIIFFTASG